MFSFASCNLLVLLTGRVVKGRARSIRSCIPALPTFFFFCLPPGCISSSARLQFYTFSRAQSPSSTKKSAHVQSSMRGRFLHPETVCIVCLWVLQIRAPLLTLCRLFCWSGCTTAAPPSHHTITPADSTKTWESHRSLLDRTKQSSQSHKTEVNLTASNNVKVWQHSERPTKI